MFAPAHAPRRVTPALSAVAAVDAWQFFMGYRYGIFNYATTSLGGTVTVTRFDLTTP